MDDLTYAPGLVRGYGVYDGDERIGHVVKLEPRRWQAETPLLGIPHQAFKTRKAAGVWLRDIRVFPPVKDIYRG